MSIATQDQALTVHDFYRENELRVIEIPSGGKMPREKGWPDSNKSFDEVEAKLDGDRFNKYGWILDDDHLIVDIDVHREDQNGYVALKKLEDRLGYKLEDRCRAIVETPSGGRHYYFTKPKTFKNSKTFPEYLGIDFISGKGKQVIAANSCHDQHPGKRYEINENPELCEIDDIFYAFLASEQKGDPVTERPEKIKTQHDGTAGSDFNTSERGLSLLIAELECQGYSVETQGDFYKFKRPGKTTESDRSGHIGKKSKEGNYQLTSFSFSDEHFSSGESVTIFHAYAVLSCNGDHSKAADALYSRGFAKPDESKEEPEGAKSVIPQERFEPFPSHLLPSPLSDLIVEGARAIGCDESFVALPLLSCVGAAIGNTARLVVKKGWNAPPNLWTLVVGESGTAKSPAFKVAKAAIQRHQKTLLDQHAKEMQVYEQEKEQYDAAKKDRKRSKSGNAEASELTKPECPQPERCMVNDTTVEALAPMLSHNPRGVLLQRDELNGWLGSFNQYKSAKGADESHWLSMFDGESITVDRKGEGLRPTYVETALVSITGGIQPAILAKSMNQEHRASGLASRFLLACPPRREQRWTDDEISDATQLLVDGLFVKLLGIDFADGESQPHFVGMSSEAKQVFRDFYNAHHQELIDLSGDSAAAWSKLLGYVPRLALIFHIIKQVNAGKPITAAVLASTMAEAIELTEWFKNEASRLYATIDDTDNERELRDLIAWIERKHDGVCTPREVTQGVKRIKTVEDAEMMLTNAAKSGLGSWDHSSPKKRVFRTT